jgi:flagellar export protein FliJ
MNRRFRLHTLERLRAAHLTAAAADLAAARRRLVQAQAEEQALVEAALRCVPRPSATPGEVTGAAHRRELLRERAERAGEQVTACPGEVAAAVEAWHTARAGLRAVEALHERHRFALAEADARRDQRVADDLAGALLSFRASTDSPHGGDAA